MENSVTVLGTRGSVPVSGASFSRFGGATTCVLVRMAGQFIILDAGTGILALPKEALSQPSLSLILSHPHADHIIGLAMCPYLFKADARMDIYGARRGGLNAREQISRIFSPPVWPVDMDALPADVRFFDMERSFKIGGVRVDTMEGEHPGGVSLIRLCGEDKSVVFITDCTLTDARFPEISEFSRDCDLLLCDGQYSEEQWRQRRTFGHSTWTAAAKLARSAGASKARMIHHDPERTDDELLKEAGGLLNIHPDCSFAFEGEVIPL
ncbi:MAG: MBL fold metallo-hydrolase [Clostridia bacterium]|nr:MBL fold metallo-hydrolase [Clostridia bacterium]